MPHRPAGPSIKWPSAPPHRVGSGCRAHCTSESGIDTPSVLPTPEVLVRTTAVTRQKLQFFRILKLTSGPTRVEQRPHAMFPESNRPQVWLHGSANRYLARYPDIRS